LSKFKLNASLLLGEEKEVPNGLLSVSAGDDPKILLPPNRLTALVFDAAPNEKAPKLNAAIETTF
jgi:hypothetical protein